MNRILFVELVLFYLKQMRRSPFYLIGLSLIPLVSISKVISHTQEPFAYMTYPQTLSGFVIPIQAVMLIVSVFMYRLTSEEAHYRKHVTLPNIMWLQFQRVLAILTIHTLFSIGALILGLLPVVAYFLVHDIEVWSFYGQLLTHALIFYVLPLLLAALWGINIGLAFGKRRIALLLLFFMWLSFGPLNTEFFSSFFFKQGYNGPNAFFFIGPLQPEVIYRELTGFLVSPSLLIKQSLIFLFHFMITLVLLSRWGIRQQHRAQMTVMAFLVCLIIASATPLALRHDQLVFDRSYDSETTTHYKTPYAYDVSQLTSSLDFQIHRLDLTLTKQDKNALDVNATYTLDSNAPTLVFSLYHLYEVRQVESDGVSLPFRQVGDFVEIVNQSVHKKIDLTIRYTIQNTSHFPITQDVTYLPAWLNWYPLQQAYPNSQLNSETFAPIIHRTERIPVTLTNDSKNERMTNLTAHKSGHYTGEVAGITWLEGFFGRHAIRERQIVVDQSWTPPDTYWPVLEETLQSIHTITNREFGLSGTLPKQVVLLSPNLEKFSYLDDKHLLLHIGSNLRLDTDLPEVIRAYMPAVFWSHSSTTSQIEPTRRAFDEAMAYWLAVELNVPSPLVPDSFFFGVALSHDERKQAEQQVATFMELSHDAQLDFLKTWHTILSRT